MPTVYEGLSPLHSKAEVSCFKLKGEDFHTKQCHIEVTGEVDGCKASTALALFAIFDGHGGKEAADFANKQVPSRIVQQLRDQIQAALDDANLVPYKELGDADPETVAIWLLEDTVVKLLPSVLKSVFRSVHDDFVARHSKSGTTATVAVVCGREVISANVGDSLAYLDTGTQVLLLSGNHRIDENEAERKRLIEAGGDICQAEFEGEAVGPLRIWPGGLAFSRSIGDLKAGDRVTPEPTVSQVTLSSSGGRIIVASDGVWDAVRSGGKGAAHRIRNQACTKAASNLRTHSKEQGSRDDITVIVADLMPDTTARLPPALSDPVSAVSISTKGDCSSSVASLAHGVNKKVWQPLETPEQWAEIWQAVMVARADAIEMSARLEDALQQAEARSTSLNNSHATYTTEVSAVSLDLLVGMFADEDRESSESVDNWEEVPVGRKAKHAAAAAAAAEAKAAAAADKGERQNSGRRGGRRQRSRRDAKDPVQGFYDADTGEDVKLLVFHEAEVAARGSDTGRGRAGPPADDATGSRDYLGEEPSGCAGRSKHVRGGRRGGGRRGGRLDAAEHGSSVGEIGAQPAQQAGQGETHQAGHCRRGAGRRRESHALRIEQANASVDEQPSAPSWHGGRGSSSGRGAYTGDAFQGRDGFLENGVGRRGRGDRGPQPACSADASDFVGGKVKKAAFESGSGAGRGGRAFYRRRRGRA